MHFNWPTIATIILVAIGAILSAPVLYRGFCRRGTGVKYEKSFLIQRAPQLASIANIGWIGLAFFSFNNFGSTGGLAPYTTIASLLSEAPAQAISWLGVAVLISGLVFMIGGWYSLGECFSTDAEVLEKQTVRKTGLLKYVMHPAYSGIIQSLLGASLACLSLSSCLLTVLVVAPLWLRRAKYEEQLLLEAFGQSYKEYADELKWRRLVPRFIPIGV